MNHPLALSPSGRTAAGRPGARPSRRRWTAVAAPLLAAALITASCGDDDDDGDIGTPALEEGLQELANFAAGAANSTEGRLLRQDAIAALLMQLGLTLNDEAPLVATGIEELHRGEAALPRSTALAPQVLLEGFGTYERAPDDTTQPFPGWVLVQPDMPPDGFVFRFQLDDDIVIDEPGGPRHVAGEIRFLEIQTDDPGTPTDPGDDVLLHVLFELSLVGESPDPVARIEYTATLDANREPETIEIGDESDLTASYFGDVSVAVRFNGAGDDASGLVQLVNQIPDPNYVVRFEFTATNIDSTETPDSAAFTFGYGRTNATTSPPWLVSADFDNFVLNPETQEVTADVEGTITYTGRLVATFQGNTREVPVNVDTDGDGDVDANDTCIDVDLMRVGSTESQNICEALGPFIAMLPFSGDGGAAGFRLPLID